MTPNVPLTVSTAIEAAEAAAVVGLSCFIGVETAAGLASDTGAGAVLAVVGVLVGIGMAAVARGLRRRRRWSRTPSVLTQILAIPVAVTLIRSGHLAAGIPLVAVAAAGLVALFSPGTTRALYPSGNTAARAEGDRRPAERPRRPHQGSRS